MEENKLINVWYDMHIHTCLSRCGRRENSVVNVIKKCVENGLNLISITDHNTSLHYDTVEKLKNKYPIEIIYGIEVTTYDGFHTLFYFETLDKLKDFSSYIDQNIDHTVLNEQDPQIITDEFDNEIDVIDYKINQNVRCSYKELAHQARQRDGLIILAHVNRGGSGILHFYDDITSFDFDAIEISKNGNHELDIEIIKKDLFEKYPYLQEYKKVYNSDGHELRRIHGKIYNIKLKELSFKGFKEWLKN